MIPDILISSISTGEKKVFEKLRNSYQNRDSEYHAFHSLRLTHHSTKRFGEVDFLICCPKGIFAIEVKGGAISLKDGQWYSRDRNGMIHSLRESPFNQSESGLHAIISKIKSGLNASILRNFTIGYGVIFPDCDFDIKSAEWDRSMYANARDCRDFEHWFDRFAKYWRNKQNKQKQPEVSDLKAVSKYLRPEFETAIPLHVLSDSARESIAKLTEDQIGFVDIISENDRVLCDGGAGTGKTFMAMELARRWTSKGLNTVLICRSPWLCKYLESRCAITGLTISTISGLEVNMRRRGISQFDALIIDEGQDLLTIEYLDQLDKIVKGGLPNGKWCFYQDINNQTGFFGEPESEAIEYLNSFDPVKWPLRKNCRNTRHILETVQTSLGADMGVVGVGDGPEVRIQTAASDSEAVEALEKELFEIIQNGGINYGDVTILSPFEFSKSIVSILPEKLKRRIAILDEYSLMNFPLNDISFTEIANFKGLENEAVIVIDLPVPEKNSVKMTNHYVGLSRARTVLSVIYFTSN